MNPIGITLRVAALALTAATAACHRYDTSDLDQRAELERRAAQSVELFRAIDPTLARFFEESAGYVIFPVVTKGAVGVGAAHGQGVVYEGRTIIGYAEMTQATIGAQLGGQQYSELIFFETPSDLQRFKAGELEFAAQASAVAAAEAAAANASYQTGVAVFTVGQSGLMFEASVGGQKFSFKPKTAQGELF